MKSRLRSNIGNRRNILHTLMNSKIKTTDTAKICFIFTLTRVICMVLSTVRDINQDYYQSRRCISNFHIPLYLLLINLIIMWCFNPLRSLPGLLTSRVLSHEKMLIHANLSVSMILAQFVLVTSQDAEDKTVKLHKILW